MQSVSSTHAPEVEPISLYFHIPFCAVRCTYCAFNVVTNAERHIPAYLTAICNEARWCGLATRGKVHTIYLGGGTPSLLSPAQIGQILDACRDNFDLTPDIEISMEINPGLLPDGYFEGLRETGVNRLSVGMQSAQDDELRLMRRDHQAEAVPRTISAARRAGFSNISLDLIFGLPNQTLDSWLETLTEALSLRPDHLSMYALELEDRTAMTFQVNRGRLPAPDEDLSAAMYESADQHAAQAGFAQYEISNWAIPGFECRHNIQYWHYGPYLGFGAGAHGFASGIRYETVRSLRRYIEQASAQNTVYDFPLTTAVEHHEVISPEVAMAEYLFTGLRMVRDGISEADFVARFGRTLDEAFGGPIEALIAQELLIREGGRMRLSSAARLISNRVSLAFL